MALTDLTHVSKRMKALRERLARKEGRSWTQQQVSDELEVPYRTFQSWENGEVETDAEGYDRVAEFYSGRLDESISRNWILFGQEQIPDLPSDLDGSDQLRRIEERLNDLAEEVQALRVQLKSVAAGQQLAPEAKRPRKSPRARTAAGSGK